MLRIARVRVMAALIMALCASVFTVAAPASAGSTATLPEEATTLVVGRATYAVVDSKGNLAPHPARGVLVRLRLHNPVFPDLPPRVVATTVTHDDGLFAFPAGSVPPGRDISVQVVAAGRDFGVQSPQGEVWTQSTERRPAAPGTMKFDIRTDSNADVNGAFAIADAMTNAVRYARSLTQGRGVGTAAVTWPAPAGNAFYSGDQISVGRPYQFSWDAILHEYGHLFSFRSALVDHLAPKGINHSADTRFATLLSDKHEGVNLAWIEGYASYFSVAGQVATGSGALGIYDVVAKSFVGDRKMFGVPLDSAPVESGGEDNETTVARVLWGFRSGGAASLGDGGVLSSLTGDHLPAAEQNLSGHLPGLMVAAGGVPFADFSSTTDTTALRISDRAGCLLATSEMAPSIVTPLDESDTPPTVQWERGGAPGVPGNGPYVLDEYTVEVWLQDWSEKLLSVEAPAYSEDEARAQLTFTGEQWNTVLRAFDDGEEMQLTFVVRGAGGGNYFTGPYQGCAEDYGAPEPTITADPVAGGYIRPAPNLARCTAADWGPGSGAFLLNGEHLQATTSYRLTLHHPTARVPDIDLGAVTTTADGTWADRRIALPAMSGGFTWQLIAVPVEGLRAEVTIPIIPGACIYHVHYDNRVEFDLSGMGAKPGTAVTMTIGAQTTQAVANAQGNFGPSGIITLPCGSGQARVQVGTVQTLDSPVVFNPLDVSVYCTTPSSTRARDGVARAPSLMGIS